MPDRQDVYQITDAPTRHSEDLDARVTRYLIAMGFRVVCFIAAAYLATGALRWTLIIAAIVLPYVAVVLANAGRSRLRSGKWRTGSEPWESRPPSLRG